ncbi:MAG: pyridoxal-phosphate dependent enzyme, partial [Acidimicrobiales bacterium]
MSLDEIKAARPAVEKMATRTPLFNAQVLSSRLGSRVVLKAENLQRTGSFKIRGVASKLSLLGRDDARAGIVVASAGNHAQACAFAASSAGVPCEVFMPEQASVSKAEATSDYGAVVHLGGASIDECLSYARAAAEETGKVLVHPFEDEAIIAGQGTLGMELAEDVEDLGTVVVPLGGGGLTAGVALAVTSMRPG